MKPSMELSCPESSERRAVYAARDPNISSDHRVLDNLLNEELLYLPKCNYFDDVQTDIEPYMRKVVATWMLEVCEEQMCEEQVLPLAVSYMDRFLAVCGIKRQQLQLLGATCLLLASKVRCYSILTVELLSAYTDYSCTCEHIVSWELLVLSQLQWNLAPITGFDFVDQIIDRCTWGNENHLIRRHAHTLVSICCTEPTLIQTPPSLIASACICSAIRGLKLPSAHAATRDVCTMTNVDPISLELLVRFVDQQVEKVVPSEKTGDAPVGANKLDEFGQPETPTEVENVYF